MHHPRMKFWWWKHHRSLNARAVNGRFDCILFLNIPVCFDGLIMLTKLMPNSCLTYYLDSIFHTKKTDLVGLWPGLKLSGRPGLDALTANGQVCMPQRMHVVVGCKSALHETSTSTADEHLHLALAMLRPILSGVNGKLWLHSQTEISKNNM